MAKKVKKVTTAAGKKTKAKKATKKGAAMKKKTTKKATKKKAATKKTSPKKAVAKTVKKVTKKVAKKAMTRRRSSKKKCKLTRTEIKKFRAMLMEKLYELTGDVTHIETGALRTSRLDAAGDLSSMPIHMADMGTDNFEQEFALGLMDSERKMLREIYSALERMDEGTYGICEGTGKAIKKARLEACPWSRYCIEYATMVEKGLVIEGEKIIDEDEDDDDIIEDFDEDDEDDEDVIGEDDDYPGFEDDEEF